jgi:electron transport complex protein RnfA
MVSIVLLVQIVTTLSEKLLPQLHAIASPYYPLFSMNALTLGVGLTVMNANFTLLELVAYAIGAPLGFAFVVIMFTSIRERIILHDRVPLPFKGSAIAFIITSFIAMAFMAFTGII